MGENEVGLEFDHSLEQFLHELRPARLLFADLDEPVGRAKPLAGGDHLAH